MPEFPIAYWTILTMDDLPPIRFDTEEAARKFQTAHRPDGLVVGVVDSITVVDDDD